MGPTLTVGRDDSTYTEFLPAAIEQTVGLGVVTDWSDNRRVGFTPKGESKPTDEQGLSSASLSRYDSETW